MTLSILLFALSPYTNDYTNNHTNEGLVQACVQSCLSFADTPGFDLKGCVVQCQDLANP